MKNWNKRPNKGTSWAKYSRKRVNFKKIDKKPLPTFNFQKKDDSLDGVWAAEPSTGEVTYYSPQEWKKKQQE